MEDLLFVYATAAVIVCYFLTSVITGRFDPFAPVWLFLVGYVQVYIIQALSYHEWAIGLRGKELVGAANFRAFWALVWFLAVYRLPLGRLIARALPSPPRNWSPTLIALVSPPLVAWGLFCAGMVIQGAAPERMSSEESLLRAFPFVMMVAAALLIVTGRSINSPRPSFLTAGLLVAACYVLIWMFNGKRSHSLIGVLSTVCAFYVARQRRPRWPVLLCTGFMGALVVAIAIGWRGNPDYERSALGFVHYLGDFKPAKILESLNITDLEDEVPDKSYETVEYGGFLLMLNTVPAQSGFDYGENYLRLFSTFIPRLLWPNKPLFGRNQWISAWQAGSELERDDDFTGPAIGILGAAHLNGGVIGTLVVLAGAALLLRTSYDYFRLYCDVPWAQFWWSVAFANAWFMVVGDDPMVWFYYNWGHACFPIVVFMWWATKLTHRAIRGEA